MAIKDTQRVGIFTESIVSKEVMGFPGTCLPVGIIAIVDSKVCKDTASKAYGIQVKEDAYKLFGKDSEMSRLIDILTISGVNKLICVPVIKPQTGDITKAEYKAALDILYNEEAVKIVICDTALSDVHKDIRDHCDKASENRKERRAHVGATAETVSGWTTLATPLNNGRVTMWGSIPLKTEDGTKYENSVHLAAACAAQDALELDPAMPLHNVQLPAELFGGLYNKWDDESLEALYKGGVAGCRGINGKIYIDRWVTTYSKDDGVNPPVADDKYQEGTVAKVKDFIDEGLRNRLATLHPRIKASIQSINEVKSDVMNWLKEQERNEIIEAPQIIKVERQADKKSRAHVYYGYNVVLPLNTIFLHGKAIV